MRYLLLTLPMVVAIGVGSSAQTANRYAVVAPSDFSGVDKQFREEQLIWATPLIKMLGCVFSQNAIRHHIKPVPVGFEPCAIQNEIRVTLDDNLIDMTVEGVAIINGTKRPFNVTLQHYPPSTNENGFQITALQIGLK